MGLENLQETPEKSINHMPELKKNPLIFKISKILTGIESGEILSPGNCLCNGNQQDSDITPPKGFGNVRAEYRAKAPPCENPPTIIRSDSMPALISLLISVCRFCDALRMPSASSGPEMSKVFRSNHDGIWKPAFNVTGIVGAVGHMTFICGGRILPIAELQP